MSALVHKDNSFTLGKKLCQKLKSLIPRQQFDIAIQSAIGSKIISRETVKAVKRCNSQMLWGRHHKKKKTFGKTKKGKEENETSWKCGNSSKCIFIRS